MMKSIVRVITSTLFIVAALVSSLFLSVTSEVEAAPGDVFSCSSLKYISKSPGYKTRDPMLLADSAGNVHLFWVERTDGPPDAIAGLPDTLIYSLWNGSDWSNPVDLFLSPSEIYNKRIAQPRAVIDKQGNIHLVYSGPDNTFFYSSTHASQAVVASAWRKATLLASDQSGKQHSIDIAYEPPQTLHIIFGREPTGRINQSLSYIRSEDSGLTWTEPVDIYTVPYLDRGVSNTRLLIDGLEIYATWTEWDENGNGQAIFFAQSHDSGKSWEQPVLLDEREGLEYERDWTSLAKVDDDELIAFWEGGFRAYRQAQYSYDGGLTWSDPIDTLDWLISDNGFAEFVRDSSGRLHLFVHNRVREGNPDRESEVGNYGLWHTVWEGGKQWRQPTMVGNPRGGNYVSAAVSGGNQVFAASFSYSVPGIVVVRCQIEDAAPIIMAPRTLDADQVSLALTSESELDTSSQVQIEPSMNIDVSHVSTNQGNSSTVLIQALIPPMLLASGLFILVLFRRRSH